MNHQKPYLYLIKCINKWPDLCFISKTTPQLCTLGGRSGWTGQKPLWEKWGTWRERGDDLGRNHWGRSGHCSALSASVCFTLKGRSGWLREELRWEGWLALTLGLLLYEAGWSRSCFFLLVIFQERILCRVYLIHLTTFFILVLELLKNLWQEVALSNTKQNMWFLT